MIRVLIADDHKVVRQGLRFLLSSEPGIEVAGEAADGAAALDAIRALRPDVVTVDLEMPRMGGYTFLRLLKSAAPTPAIAIAELRRKILREIAISFCSFYRL